MNTFDINGIEQIVFGVYLIAHGLIYLIFLFYFKDKEKEIYTGWSGKSLFSSILPNNINKLGGKIIWIMITILFFISGIGVLDIVDFKNFLLPILVTACLLGILAQIVFWEGLSPTPYHWVLGLVINFVILSFIVFLTDNLNLLVIILVLIWFYGMFFHTKVISTFTKNLA